MRYTTRICKCCCGNFNIPESQIGLRNLCDTCLQGAQSNDTVYTRSIRALEQASQISAERLARLPEGGIFKPFKKEEEPVKTRVQLYRELLEANRVAHEKRNALYAEIEKLLFENPPATAPVPPSDPGLYTAPEPSKEQLSNAKVRGYDPYMVSGRSTLFAMPRDHWSAAAGLIHDVRYIHGGTMEDCIDANIEFAQNCFILCEYNGSTLAKFELHAFIVLVNTCGPTVWKGENRNNSITEAQYAEDAEKARDYIARVDAWLKYVAQSPHFIKVK